MASALRKIPYYSFYKARPLIYGNKQGFSFVSRKQALNQTKQSANLLIRPSVISKMLFSSSALSEQFSESQKLVTTLNEEPDNDIKLKLYALFKQGTVGKCNKPKPGALDFVGKAKWQAWNSLGDVSQDDAKKQYVDMVSGLLSAQNQNQPSADSGTESQYFGLKVTNEKGALTIMFNRPDKKNAITPEMYESITKILNEANKDDTVAFAIVRGSGDYFSSGNDLSNFIKLAGGTNDLKDMAEKSAVLLRNYVDAFINFSKPLVGVINGPAIGISVTVLGLFDLIYAADKASFHTPFSALGQSPEGCSSYTFPKLMGSPRANEILMLNKKVTAAEAKVLGLLTEVYPAATFEEEVAKKIAMITSLPKVSLAYAKQLNRDVEIDILRKVNAEECEKLKERWLSDDCKKAVMAFFQGKAKM